ncbi:hypothetical protein [Couchioplanes azureus]|uniref:hypothetical protein n=1 Tax=Couchioplanes caeruleus TaxID=56438 RepID=UPI0016702AFE|nr:hypothetical protein [Couchioplanes caeruleus]GGQ63384.1 hypothetical protein GCM10010166_36490 [Couchioplanes caeruleus subsp. azureus]
MRDHPLEVGEDATTFFQPRAMVFVTMLWVIALGWLACGVLVLLGAYALGARPAVGDLVLALESVLIGPPVVAGTILLLAWRRLGWLKSSVRGLEFGATGRRGVHLPWRAVASVGLRRWGPFTELVITPTSLRDVTELPGPGRRPRMLRRDGGPAFVVDVGLMSPGPQTLLAELHRRIPSRV